MNADISVNIFHKNLWRLKSKTSTMINKWVLRENNVSYKDCYLAIHTLMSDDDLDMNYMYINCVNFIYQ